MEETLDRSYAQTNTFGEERKPESVLFGKSLLWRGERVLSAETEEDENMPEAGVLLSIGANLPISWTRRTHEHAVGTI
jgi:hypothetical protein